MINPPIKNNPNRPPVEIKRKGVSPEWANLPRRKCDDCGKSYKPARPLLKDQRGFCCDNCRKSYHKHGGAYRKLKVEMKRMIEREFTGIYTALNGLTQRLNALDEQTQTPAHRQLVNAISQSLSPSPADCTPAPRFKT